MKRKNIAHHEASGFPMPRMLVVFVSVLLLQVLFPGKSRGADVTGTSSTYLFSRQAADETKELPLFEYFNFSVRGDNSLSAHVGAWGRYDFETSNTNLQYGYVRYARPENNTVVNLGRVMVFEGVARELIDGVSARTDLMGGFGISVFDGIPVETGIAAPAYIGNNIVYGGRLTHGVTDVYKVGASYLKEEKRTDTFREETGLDVWLRPFSSVDIVGKSSYNSATEGWMEHTYALTIGPFSRVTLGADFSKINYKDYFSSLTSDQYTSSGIFKVINPLEKSTATGGSINIALTDHAVLAADYKQYDFSVSGAASSYGGTLSSSTPGLHAAGISYRRMDSDESTQLRYSEYRVFAFEKYRHLNFGIDFFDVVFDEKINGIGNALSFSVVADYELTEQLKIGADVEYAKNPDFDKDIRAFFKVLYSFGAREGV